MSAVVLVAAKGGRVGKAQYAHCHLDLRRMGSGHGRRSSPMTRSHRRPRRPASRRPCRRLSISRPGPGCSTAGSFDLAAKYLDAAQLYRDQLQGMNRPARRLPEGASRSGLPPVPSLERATAPRPRRPRAGPNRPAAQPDGGPDRRARPRREPATCAVTADPKQRGTLALARGQGADRPG